MVCPLLFKVTTPVILCFFKIDIILEWFMAGMTSYYTNLVIMQLHSSMHLTCLMFLT